MPLVQNFTAAQNQLLPGTIILVDSSTGSDAAVSQRRAYIQNSAGEYLVTTGVTTDYNQWPYVDSTLSLAILTEDSAASIRVDWLNSSNVVLYTLTQTFTFALFNKQFLYELVQGLSPSITLDTGYDPGLANLWVAILGAINSVEVGNDIQASQACLDRASYIQSNQSIFF